MERKIKILIFALSSVFFFLGIFYFIKQNSSHSFLSQLSNTLEKESHFEEEISGLKEKILSLERKLEEPKINSEIKENLKKEIESIKNGSQKSKEEIRVCQNLESTPKLEVIFNEICWMGDENSPANEWIELKNVSKKEIDLEGWQLFNKNQKIKIIFEGKTKLLPGEILLLKRGDDFVGAIRNSKEALYLFDKDCNLQDKVEATSTWIAGDEKTRRTAERREDFTWQTSEKIGGTPGEENSQGLKLAKEEEKEKEEEENYPRITLDLPSQIFSQREFEVYLSVSDLAYNTYDIKISILKFGEESEKKRTISEVSLNGEEWQDSYKYLTNVFTGDSFSGKFKLRIIQDFSGEAEILVKIRNKNKKIVLEHSEKIRISRENFFLEPIEKPTISGLETQNKEVNETFKKTEDFQVKEPQVLVEDIPSTMKKDEILTLKVKVTGISGIQKFKMGLSAPGDEEYPPSYTSIISPQEGWQWSRNYFEIEAKDNIWEGTVYLKLNPNSTRYNNIQDKVLLSSRLSIDGKAGSWNYHGEILISE